jgi:hypothetical protein
MMVTINMMATVAIGIVGRDSDLTLERGMYCMLVVESGVKILCPPPVTNRVLFITVALSPALSIGIGSAMLQESVSTEYT